MTKPKKTLGQHFLNSRPALKKTARALGITSGQTVIEIGGGHGELTRELLYLGAKVICVEKDEDLAQNLASVFPKEIEGGDLTVIPGDILDISTDEILAKAGLKENQSYKLAGNIPYYITGSIIRRFLSAKHQPESMVILIQKEVAERIIAKEGKESVLSISSKVYGYPKIVGKVKAGSFFPSPKVDSAILAIDSISKDFFTEINEECFFKLLKTSFGQKRKKISGNLKQLYSVADITDTFDKCFLDKDSRAEDLSLSDFKCLGQILCRKTTGRKQG